MDKNDMKAALKGAALLVSAGKYEDLTTLVPLDSFDQKYVDNCVLYHVYGNYGEGLRTLDKDSTKDSDDFGFSSPCEHDECGECGEETYHCECEGTGHRTYEGLNVAWTVVIKALREMSEEQAPELLSRMMEDAS